MRVMAVVVLALAMCGNALALETSAGADTVNASQVGISAKIDASNAVITSGLNAILKCNQDGRFYDSTHNVCIDPTEPLAKKIAACTTNKQFYNQTTEACQSLALPPDLTTQTNSNTSLIKAVLNCNQNRQFYDQTTGACVSGAGGVSSMVMEQCNDKNKSNGGCTTPACPSGYFLSGCSYGGPNSAYVALGPTSGGNACSCNKYNGGGALTCTAFCIK